MITTPPARYDAEGNAGIPNIRLKERVKDHIGGNAFGSYLYGAKYNYGYGGLSLQFNRQRVTAYLNGSGAYGKTGYVERNGRSIPTRHGAAVPKAIILFLPFM